RAGDQEVLLLEAQLTAELGAVVRVEDLADVLRADHVLDGLAVLAGPESGQVERGAAGPGPPQPEQVDGLRPIPRNQHVTWLTMNGLTGDPAAPVPGRVVGDRLGAAVEPDRLPVVGLGEFPRVAVVGPVVRPLDLRPVAERLLEDPEVVADAVAD